ncbi:UNVERIFIED_CONTAM: hypothetical protein Sradi_6936000 [Sesamum radiatum]|uniref:Uncharacterized protein n=1 Tax=Sesamum radiatum TaxID=300843 RepID=A0AAW2JIS8_SESRA
MGRIASSQVVSSPTAGKQIAISLAASSPGRWPRVRWGELARSQVASSQGANSRANWLACNL